MACHWATRFETYAISGTVGDGLVSQIPAVNHLYRGRTSAGAWRGKWRNRQASSSDQLGRYPFGAGPRWGGADEACFALVPGLALRALHGRGAALAYRSGLDRAAAKAAAGPPNPKLSRCLPLRPGRAWEDVPRP